MDNWLPGYTQTELDDAQERYGLRFPPDLIALFLERRPSEGYNWNTEDNRIRDRLRFPLEMLVDGVENGFWWPAWGQRPRTAGKRLEIVAHALAEAPKLIPLIGHRFLPDFPSEAGNPVFSMYGFDTIIYGANLAEYFRNEFAGSYDIGPARHIPFWSDLVDGWSDAYAYYEQAQASRAEDKSER